MDIETIMLILQGVVPVVVGLVVFVITYFVRGKSIKEARAEASEAKGTMQDILNYYDPEKPYCETSDEALELIAEHPYSYCIEDSEKKLIFDGLAVEEIVELEKIIGFYEADMNVDYTLHTSKGDWRIYYGTPVKLVKEVESSN